MRYCSCSCASVCWTPNLSNVMLDDLSSPILEVSLLGALHFPSFTYFISNSATFLFVGLFLSLLALAYLVYQFLLNNSVKEGIQNSNKVKVSGAYRNVVGLLKSDIQKSFHQIMKPLSQLSYSKELSRNDQKTLNEIVDSASSLLKSINSITLLNNYEDKQISKQKINLYQLSRETVSLFKCFAKQREINLNFKYNLDKDILIEFYAERMKIVLYNLIFNAIKYSEEKSEVSFLVENNANQIRFKINDEKSHGKVNELDLDLLENIDKNEIENTETFTGWSFISREVEELMQGKFEIVNVFNKSTYLVDVPFVEVISAIDEREVVSDEILEKASENFLVSVSNQDDHIVQRNLSQSRNTSGVNARNGIEKYEEGTLSTPVVLNKKDEDWLIKMDNDITLNISNIQYGVEALAENMNVSRTHLFRKVKKLTSQSPNGYIREKKLLHARLLLEAGSCKSVKDLAYKVGILKPSYFTKLYFNRFGVKPSSYLGR